MADITFGYALKFIAVYVVAGVVTYVVLSYLTGGDPLALAAAGGPPPPPENDAEGEGGE